MTGAGVPSPDAWLAPLRYQSVCFDTMIIRHLVHGGGGDILKQAFAGRMLWPDGVAAELHVQAHGFLGRGQVPNLASFLATCGATVLELSEDESQEAEDIQREMHTAKTLRSNALADLGEAQCLVVCRRDRECVLVCQDGRARASARYGEPKVPLFGLIDVLYLAVRLGLCKAARAWALYELTGHPIATSRDRFIGTAGTLAGCWRAEQRSTGSRQDNTQAAD
jgi:predicted nucleic acid-binding protein